MSALKIMIIISTIFAIITLCRTNPIKTILESFQNAPTKELFKVFHYIYEKTYDLNTEEGVRRYKIFKENLKKIEEVNSKNLPYKFGVNRFTDMTKEEFKKNYLMSPDIKKKAFVSTIRFLSEEGYFDKYADADADADADSAEDGQNKNSLTVSPKDWSKYLKEPRDQGNCGSCWTFATTGLVEGLLGIKSNKVAEYLSPQQLVDCDVNNKGCDGGIYGPALNFVKTTGLIQDNEYPYKAVKQYCNAKNNKTQKIKAFSYCSNNGTPSCSFDIVYRFLTLGPVGVGIDGNAIQSYSSGIFTDDCNEDNHAVLLVGYGIEQATSTEYFIVRNSWAADWGENGYIRVAKNDSNNYSCFVNNEAFTATLA
jgi:hypothetical protein